MSNASKVETALADLTSAVAAGDLAESQAALSECLAACSAVTKAKMGAHPKAASPASTSTDADVVVACDACSAAVVAAQALPPTVAAAGKVGGLFDGSFWSKFLASLPMLIDFIRDFFKPAPAPTP